MAGQYTYDYPRPMLTADVILLRVTDGALEALLIKRGRAPEEGRWAFPGGFMDVNERLANTATRELAEETGIADVILEPFGVFDAPKRDPRGRVITVGHIGLLCGEEVDARAGDDAADAGWFTISDMPALAFDHEEMLQTALEWLAARLGVSTEEPDCFLALSPEEQAAVRGCLAEVVES